MSMKCVLLLIPWCVTLNLATRMLGLHATLWSRGSGWRDGNCITITCRPTFLSYKWPNDARAVLIEMGKRFAILSYYVEYYRQEAKACCALTFGGCRSSDGFWNSQWYLRGLWYGTGQTDCIFWAKEKHSIWVTCILSGSTRANQRYGGVCYSFTRPCENLWVRQCGWDDSRSSHW